MGAMRLGLPHIEERIHRRQAADAGGKPTDGRRQQRTARGKGDETGALRIGRQLRGLSADIGEGALDIPRREGEARIGEADALVGNDRSEAGCRKQLSPGTVQPPVLRPDRYFVRHSAVQQHHDGEPTGARWKIRVETQALSRVDEVPLDANGLHSR